MNEAEAMRKKVVQRGIKDAYIAFYYNDENVKIQELVSLLRSLIAELASPFHKSNGPCELRPDF